MAHTLTARAGFDWDAVKWGAPHERRTEVCSYCRTPLRDDECPLTLATKSGWVAEFCEACQRTWWGFEF
jgi:hypothetical protein